MANNIYELTATFKADDQGFLQELNRVDSALQHLSHTLKSNGSEFNNFFEGAKGLSKSLDYMESLGKETEQVGEEMQKTSILADALFDSLNEIGKLDLTAFTEGLQLTDKLSGMDTILGGVTSGLQELGNQFANIDDVTDLATAGIQVYAEVWKASLQEVIQLTEQAVDSFNQLEYGTALVSTIMDTTVMSTEEMENNLLQFSASSGNSISNVTDAMYWLLSATQDTASSMEVLDQANMLAVGGNTTLTNATQVLTNLLNVYAGDYSLLNSELSDNATYTEAAQSAIDGLFKTQQLGVMNMSQLTNNLYKTTLAAAQYGVSLTEVEAGYVATTKSGQNATRAATNLQRMFYELGNTTSSTSVGYKLLQATGSSFEELISQGYSLKDVLEIVADLAEAEGVSFQNYWARGTTAGMAALAILEQETATGANAYEDAISQITNATGVAEEAFNTMEETASRKLTKLNSAWDALVASFASTDVSTSQAFMTWVDSFNNAADVYLEEIETTITTMTEYLPRIVDTLGPAIKTASQNIIPLLIDAAGVLANAIVTDVLPGIVPGIIESIPSLIEQVVDAAIGFIGNIPSLLIDTIEAVFSSIIGLIGDGIETVTYLFTGTLPEEIATGIHNSTGFERVGQEFLWKVQTSLANIFGDEDWAESINMQQQAQTLSDTLLSAYEEAQANIEKYSFKSWKIDSEAEVNTALTLLGSLQGVVDENGNVTNASLASTLVSQLQSILGEDSVSLGYTWADWVVNLYEETHDADGNLVTDASEWRDKIKQKLKEALGGNETSYGTDANGNPIDAETLSDTTYKIVASIFSQYPSAAEVTYNKDSIKRNIKEQLQDAGVDAVTAEVIANGAITEGAITTWYDTPASTGWDNSNFITWMKTNGHLPDDSGIDYDLIINAMASVQEGDMTLEEFHDQLVEWGFDEEQITNIITLGCDYSQVTAAIDELKTLRKQYYETQLISSTTESIVTINEGIYRAGEGFAEAQENGDSASMSSYYKDYQQGMNEYRTLWEDTWGQDWLLRGGYTGTGMTKEDYITSLMGDDETWSGYQDNLYGMAEAFVYTSDVATQFLSGNTTGEAWLQSLFFKLNQGTMTIDDVSYALDTMHKALTATNDSDLYSYIQLLSQYFGDDEQAAWAFYYALKGIENQAYSTKEALKTITVGGSGDTTETQYHWGLSTEDWETYNSGEFNTTGYDTVRYFDSETGEYVTTQRGSKFVSSNYNQATGEGEVVYEQGATSTYSIGYNAGSQYYEGIQDALADAKANWQVESGEAADMIVEGFNTRLNDDGEAVKSTVIRMAEQDIKKPFQGELGMQSPSTVFKQYGSYLIEGLVQGISTNTSKVVSILNTLIDNLKDSMSDIKSVGTTTGNNFGSALVAGIRAYSGSAYSAGYNLGYRARNGASAWDYSDFFTLGQYAGEGYIQGVRSYGQAAYSAGYYLGLQAKRGTEDGQDSASPSKVFRKLGKYAGEGYVLGIEDEYDNVYDAAVGLAESATSANLGIESSLSIEAKPPQWAQDLSSQITNMGVYIDGDQLVGRTINRINKQLGKMTYNNSRGNVIVNY